MKLLYLLFLNFFWGFGSLKFVTLKVSETEACTSVTVSVNYVDCLRC